MNRITNKKRVSGWCIVGSGLFVLIARAVPNIQYHNFFQHCFEFRTLCSWHFVLLSVNRRWNWRNGQPMKRPPFQKKYSQLIIFYCHSPRGTWTHRNKIRVLHTDEWAVEQIHFETKVISPDINLYDPAREQMLQSNSNGGKYVCMEMESLIAEYENTRDIPHQT